MYTREKWEPLAQGGISGVLVHAVKQANARINQRNVEWYVQGGSTCTAVVLCGEMAYGAHVGDSRAYLVRHGQVRQLSQDHTWVAECVRNGQLTPQEARAHPRRYILHRCLGTENIDVDTFHEPIEDGDSLLLCTVGLTDVVEDHEIGTIVEQYTLQESVHHLTQLAKERGSRHDITTVLVKISLHQESR